MMYNDAKNVILDEEQIGRAIDLFIRLNIRPNALWLSYKAIKKYTLINFKCSKIII